MLFSHLRINLLLLLLVAITPAVLLTIHARTQQRQASLTNVQETTAQLAGTLAHEQQLVIDDAEHLLGSLASNPALTNPSECATELQQQLAQHARYANFGVANLAGDVTCSAVALTGSVNVSDRDYFQQALETGAFVVGDVSIGRIIGRPTLSFGMPLYAADEQPAGVLYGSLDLGWLNQRAGTLGLPEGSSFTVMDSRGAIIARYPDTRQYLGEVRRDAPLYRAILEQDGQGTATVTGLDDVRRFYAFAPWDPTANSEVYVALGLPEAEVFGPADRRLTQNLIILGMVSLAALALAWTGVHLLVVRRVERLVRTARRLGSGDLSARTGMANQPGELGQLAYTMDEMAISLERMERQLRQAALHDPLTGLPNRALLMERVRQAIDRTRRGQQATFAVLFIDLDRFKLVNDSAGHTVGDELLVAVAGRIRHDIRPSDLAARLGGDEFAVLVDDIDSSDEALTVAERIMTQLCTPFTFEAGREYHLSCSIGIAEGSGDYVQPEDLLRDADIAMYHAKDSGRNAYRIYSPAMRDRATSLFALSNDLREALERDEFVLHYQPITHLPSGRVVGAEALLRWQHPERGMLNPASFLPFAEESGQISAIGWWALERACRQGEAWRQRFGELLISVNLSSRQLAAPDIISHVEEALARSGLPPQALILELTESAIMEDSVAAHSVLSRLRERQLQVAVDDFGTGYSSLSLLHQLPVDYVKLDRSFTVSLTDGSRHSAIVRAMLAMSEALGMRVIAEGIETTEQRAQLIQLGCTLGQGYLFASPLSSSAMTHLLDGDGRREPAVA